MRTALLIVAMVCAMRKMATAPPEPPPATQFILPSTMRDFDRVCLKRDLEHPALICRSAREVREFFALVKASQSIDSP